MICFTLLIFMLFLMMNEVELMLILNEVCIPGFYVLPVGFTRSQQQNLLFFFFLIPVVYHVGFKNKSAGFGTVLTRIALSNVSNGSSTILLVTPSSILFDSIHLLSSIHPSNAHVFCVPVGNRAVSIELCLHIPGLQVVQ